MTKPIRKYRIDRLVEIIQLIRFFFRSYKKIRNRIERNPRIERDWPLGNGHISKERHRHRNQARRRQFLNIRHSPIPMRPRRIFYQALDTITVIDGICGIYLSTDECSYVYTTQGEIYGEMRGGEFGVV